MTIYPMIVIPSLSIEFHLHTKPSYPGSGLHPPRPAPAFPEFPELKRTCFHEHNWMQLHAVSGAPACTSKCFQRGLPFKTDVAGLTQSNTP